MSLGSIKDKSRYYKKARWVQAIVNSNGTNTYDNNEFRVIRFREVDEATKSYYQPIANKLMSKKSWVIETNNFYDYKIGDRLIIKDYISDSATKDYWIIENIIKFTRKNDQLSLRNLRINPSTSFVLELA